MVRIYEAPTKQHNKPVFGLIGTDKQGKGTTWRHTLYGLSQLGYKVLGVTFPSYNTVGGFGAEINLSYKQVIDILPGLGIKTDGWSKSKFSQIYSYVLDRGMSAEIIDKHLDEGYIVVTKRSSKATHGAYQKAFNSIDEKTTFQLEPFIQDPIAVMDMLSAGIRLDDFADKGNIVLDDFESQDQDPVAKIQNRYTMQPETIGANYGFHVPADESPQRLETILSGITEIMWNKEGFAKPDANKFNPIKILGREEPKWDLRTKEGLKDFTENFTGADLLESWFSHPFEIINSYEDLFRIDGKLLKYPMSIKEEVNTVINKFK